MLFESIVSNKGDLSCATGLEGKKMLNRIVTAFVLFGLLISVPTSAAPDGSLRKMLDTKITLIEYITLRTDLESVKRLATGKVTKWGDYSSVVELRVFFRYDDSELTFELVPANDHYFSTVAEAKSYCRDLSRAERSNVWLQLFADSSPNGWTANGVGAEGFRSQLYTSTKIVVGVDRGYIKEQLPEGEYSLLCKAYLDDEGEIKNFSYNL
jgi:hypothetical protein